jgi:hypothetical protein
MGLRWWWWLDRDGSKDKNNQKMEDDRKVEDVDRQ